MIIIDLDDTIFETRSMNPSIFDSAISLIKDAFDTNNSLIRSEEVIDDLWSLPIDIVFEKYNVNELVVSEFYKRVKEVDHQHLNIRPFEDYSGIKTFKGRKILVTTGLKELQWAKIMALGIENDFDEIHIDDPRLVPRKHKIDIFRQILLDSNKLPSEIWVIGDNPESEIQAGSFLGMNTIQRRSNSKKRSELANYYIESLSELKEIIDKC